MQTMNEKKGLKYLVNVLNILIASIGFMHVCIYDLVFRYRMLSVDTRYYIGFDRVIFRNEK